MLAEELDNVSRFFFMCLSRSEISYFSIQNTGAYMLDDNCEHALEGVPTSRAYGPSIDCTCNARNFYFMRITVIAAISCHQRNRI